MSSLMSGRARSGYGASIPGGDQLSWYFFRVSGVALIFLACGHLFITHYLNVPSATTFEFVADRWANPLWRTFDWLLLLMALWHGLMGLRVSITDYIRSAGWRVIGHSTVWMLGLIFTVLGTVTIVTFNEQEAAVREGPMWLANLLGYSLFAFAIIIYVASIVGIVYIVRNLQLGSRPIYAGDTGQYAWVLHKLTGLGVLFFLLIHIVDIMLIGLGQDVYDHSVEFYANPFILPMEVLLVGAVIYHTLNGIRVILVDFWPMGVHRQKMLFYAALIGSVALTIPSGIIILLHEL